jgi:hypothetical protein
MKIIYISLQKKPETLVQQSIVAFKSFLNIAV